jgi:hypothetical protein
MIFSTREAVSKVMSEFQRDGIIETRNRRIVVNRQLERVPAEHLDPGRVFCPSTET